MADENILQIGARVDLGALKSGMADAAATVKGAAAQISADFASTAAVTTSAAQQIAQQLMKEGVSAVDAASALRNLGYSAKEATAATAVLSEATTAATAATQEFSASQRGLALGVGPIRAVQEAMAQLQGTAQGSTRAAAGFLAGVLGLGPAIAAAFPIIGAVALLQILGTLAGKVDELIDKSHKMREEWASAVTSMTEETNRLNRAYDEALIRVTELGQGQLARLIEEQTLLAHATSDLGGSMERLTAQTSKFIAEEVPWYDGILRWGAALTSVQPGMATISDFLERLRTDFRDVSREAQDFGIALHATLASEGTAAGLRQVDEELTSVYQRLQANPADTGLQQFKTLLESIQVDLSREANTQFFDRQAAALRTANEALAEHNQLLADMKRHNDEAITENERWLRSQIAAAKAVDDAAKLATRSVEEMTREQIRVQNEATRLAAEEWRKETQGIRQQLDEQVRAATEMANRRLAAEDQAENRRLQSHSESVRKWAADELQTLQQWYTQQASVLQRAEQTARDTFGVTSAEYRRMVDRMNALGDEFKQRQKAIVDEMQQHYAQVFNQITSTLNHSITQWVSGHLTFKQAAQQVWDSVLSDAINAILKIAEQWILQHVLMGAATQLFGAQVMAAGAAQHATQSAENVASVTSDAGVAAAGAMAYWSAINPIIAPAMAAAQFAQTMAYAGPAAFEGGGLVPNTGLALVHGGEMVLPKNLSQGFQTILQNGGGRPGGSFTFGDIHISNRGAEMTARDLMDKVLREARRRNLLPG